MPRLHSIDLAEPDQALLRAVLDGIAGAEEVFVARYRPLIEGCIRRLARCYGARITAEDVEDLVGEVWLTLLDNDRRRLRLFDPRRQVKVSTWVTLLARNRMIDWLRSDRRHLTGHLPLSEAEAAPSGEASPAELLADQERAALAARVWQTLTAQEREFLEACYDDSYDGKTLARQLGLAPGTVYSRKFKIVAKLAQRALDAEQRQRPRAGVYRAAS